MSDDNNTHLTDGRIHLFIEAAEQLKRGEYHLDVPVSSVDELGRLGLALLDLAKSFESRYQELRQLDLITSRINAGLLLDEVLENVYQDFRELIPYNRIGFSLIEDDGQTVRARWAKIDNGHIYLRRGYSSILQGSSLQQIVETGQPRIINDLEDYLRQKPTSESTQLIVAEGIRSSLTCPLIANGVPVGFIFFSSLEANSYSSLHIEIFQRIAAQLSVIVEKGRLVSELAAQKDAIERQNRELMRLNELKNTFLGIAAHDLRSPLGVIQMAINFMLDARMAVTDAEQEMFLRDVLTQSEHMLNLIDDVLDVTHIEAGKLELRPEDVDLRHFLEEAVQRHAQMASPKGTQVLLDHVSEGIVQADPHRLRQVVDNLISNAVKYSPAGSTVQVWAEQLEDEWRISVKDQGPGITQEDRKRLFQDFARLSATPTGGERSTGLGLAISRRVIEGHNGRINVDSVPGEGATFWFTLPA